MKQKHSHYKIMKYQVRKKVKSINENKRNRYLKIDKKIITKRKYIDRSQKYRLNEI